MSARVTHSFRLQCRVTIQDNRLNSHSNYRLPLFCSVWWLLPFRFRELWTCPIQSGYTHTHTHKIKLFSTLMIFIGYFNKTKIVFRFRNLIRLLNTFEQSGKLLKNLQCFPKILFSLESSAHLVPIYTTLIFSQWLLEEFLLEEEIKVYDF